MVHIVCYSGGHSSALVAIEVVRKYGHKNVILVNHDISSKVESSDTKRFKHEVATELNLQITFVNAPSFEIRTPLVVSLQEKAFKTKENPGLCTSRLKTQPFMAWLQAYFPDPTSIRIYYGYDKTETARITRRTTVMLNAGYQVVCPLAEWERTIHSTEELGISRPNTYEIFKHANCVGCLKAGKQHWYCVYVTRPDIFKEAIVSEGIIGYSIIKGVFLKDLIPYFNKMKASNIEPTEHTPHQTFWAQVRRIISNLEEDEKACVSCMA